MGYTCEICTDYIDPTKKDEILERVAIILGEIAKNAPSGTAIPSGAKQNYNVTNITQ